MSSRKLSPHNNTSFSKINLKLEDKIILGIGALFLICLLIFVSVANRAFDYLGEQNKKWEKPLQNTQPHKTLPTQKIQQEPDETPFREPESSFYQLEKAFEENRKKRDEAFRKIEKNFKERFKKLAKLREQRRKRLHKWFDEAVARSDADFEKKAAAFSEGLPKYAIAGKKRKKSDDSLK